ncbi:ES8L3 protein, partial [Chauna torquata]|nr:ES8L3 protein [Chauna torquata]
RAEYPNSEQVPHYIPVFSDGWLPPLMLNSEQQEVWGGAGDSEDAPLPASVSPPCSEHASPLCSPCSHRPPATRTFPATGTPLFPALKPVRALYEFQGRNPQELSVRMGDTLQVLDQQKKWWLVQNSLGEKGYVPSNVLEPLGQGYEDSTSQGSPPKLHMGSSPAEVTAWLKDKGFSRMCV